MGPMQKTITPIDGSLYVERPYNSANEIAASLKHSAQTPLCAERFAEAFKSAGLPKGLFQHLVLTHDDAAKLIGTDGIDYVAFTGSVPGGHAVVEAASKRFIGLGLELGGCD